jgi:hypothetical protein
MLRRNYIPFTLACPAIPGLRVLPVVRYRLSFARAAAQHVRTTEPGTVIAVDLPHPLTHSDWLSAALGAFPKPSTFMIHRPPHTLAAPIVANDAACLALHTALEVGRRYYCVDDMLPAEPPDPGGELQDDECLPQSLEVYFRTAWQPVGSHIIPRGARVAERLRRLAARAEKVLFVCEWRLWPFVANAAEARAESECEPNFELPSAIVPEDALLLWQAGFFDDLPALAWAAYTAEQNRFRKLDYLRKLVGRFDRGFAQALRTTLSPAINLLETALQQQGPTVSTQLAASCLTSPKWGVDDLSAGSIPQLGSVTNSGIEPIVTPFSAPDITKCERLYPCSRAETLRFYPPREAEVRRYWGPGSTPPLTRSEASIVLSPDDRWSVGANYRAMALAAEMMREEGRRLAPDVATDLFTPAVWVFCREGDGDHRSLLDSNAAYRRTVQISDLPGVASTIEAGNEEPDVIYTLSATRCVHGVTCPGINHDIVSAIGLVYTGPQFGPERYQAVTESGRPVPRLDPSCDSEIAGFELVDRNIAFCVKYATGAVLLAHFQGFRPTAKIEEYAKEKGVHIIRMPLRVLPRYLQIAIQRRIFMSKTMRWHGFGDRIADRMVFWRIPDPHAPMQRQR